MNSDKSLGTTQPMPQTRSRNVNNSLFNSSSFAVSTEDNQESAKAKLTKYCLNIRGSGKVKVDPVLTSHPNTRLPRAKGSKRAKGTCKSVLMSPCAVKGKHSRSHSKCIPGIIDTSGATDASTQIAYGTCCKNRLTVPKSGKIKETSQKCASPSAPLNLSILSPTNARHGLERTVKRSFEGTRLKRYWRRKEKITEKYRKIFSELEAEEAKEIVHAVSHRMIGEESYMKNIIEDIKDEYERTKDLMQRQKITELEELLGEFRTEES